MKDYYYILGLNKNATLDEIKKAYRKLSLKFHPDQNNGDKFFEERFRDINEAYETLSDNAKRKTYDEILSGNNVRGDNKKSDNSYASQNKQSDFKQEAPKSTYTTPPKPETKSQKPANQKSSKGLKSFLVTVVILLILSVVRTMINESIKTNAINNFHQSLDNNTTQSYPVDTSSYMSPDTTSSVSVDTSSYMSPDTTSSVSVDTSSFVAADTSTMPSKEETSDWILKKLKKYTNEKSFYFSFGTYYLVILFNDEYTYNDVSKSSTQSTVMIPIADISDIDYTISSLTFITNRESIILQEHDNKTRVMKNFTIAFDTDSETDLGERIKKAFFHLKKFYQLPPNNEPF
jgi:hypothetical protein